MADLATEIANLNAQAAELLAKYNGAFKKLDEETQNKILELQSKAQALQAQIESSGFKFDDNGILVREDGSEISVGNALKLGGKSLEDIATNNIDIYNWNLNGSYSFSENNFNSNTLYETNIDVKTGDKIVIFGFVSGYLDGDNDKFNSHLLCRFKINDTEIVDGGSINASASYISVSSIYEYISQNDEILNVKFQIRGKNYNTNGSCITIDSNNDDKWSGARVIILHIKGA